MNDKYGTQIALLELVLKTLRAKARGLAGRKQDSGLRAAIEVVEDLIEETKNENTKQR